ncbi:phage integrase central domain-containing protein [Microbulbifer sp. CnH-101-G]|uniref:phage integrase central domain-containing protein n=1 Tax=Microbulbifer sp. CnH-101-G TaxID=3243393 RepID=UPI004038FBD6
MDRSFAAVAEEWWNQQKGTWTEDHANRVWTRLRDNTFPRIGQRPIAYLQPQDVIAIVRDIEERDAMMLRNGFYRIFAAFVAMPFRLANLLTIQRLS